MINPRRALKNPDAWALGLGLAAAGWFLVTRWLAVYAEAINWDEFALLARADRSLRFGTVEGGGRPGLVTVVLVPFVRGCVDSVAAVVNARLLWQLVTITYLIGVYAVVRRWISYSKEQVTGRGEAVLAVALLAFLPAFFTWSIQVRTDQFALAAGIWGCVLLMASQSRFSIAAGVLFAIAVLSTQKALYVMAFGGCLFLTASVSRALSAPHAWRGEIVTAVTRATLTLAGMAVVIGAYYLLVPSTANLVSPSALASSAATMDWYAERLGFRSYTVHATRLWPHWLLFGSLAFWTWLSLRRRDRRIALRLVTCWSILALGLAVAVVHGSRFPYFLMTAGLFPAVALALAAGPTLEKMGSRAPLVVGGLLAILAAINVPEALEMAAGTQDRQRATMRLVQQLPLRDMRGYQVEAALFCSKDPNPLPEMFSQQIQRRRAQGPRAFDSFIDEFRTRPIAYIVESYRMHQFSLSVRKFWDEHYVPYAASLQVAGFRISGVEVESTHEVIAPGMYRWFPDGRRNGAIIWVDGRPIAPGEALHLNVGPFVVSRSGGEIKGLLVIALGDAVPGEIFPFYDVRQMSRLRGES